MPTAHPSQVFQLDQVETKVTAPVTNVKTRDETLGGRVQGNLRGLNSLAGALKGLAQFEKQNQIREDVLTAQEAAAREDVMPGGLLPIAQQAYRNVVDINTSHAAILEAKRYIEGDEYATTIKAIGPSSKEKSDTIRQSLDSFREKALTSIQDPSVIQNLNLKLNEIFASSEKEIYKIERDQQTVQSIEAISNTIKDNVDFADKTNVPLGEIFTAEWVKNMADDVMTVNPWMDEKEAKLLVFKVFSFSDSALKDPSLITSLLSKQFSKDFTYSSLLIGTGDDAEQFRNIIKDYNTRVKARQKELADSEKNLNKLLEGADESKAKKMARSGASESDIKSYLESTGRYTALQINTKASNIIKLTDDTGNKNTIGSSEHNFMLDLIMNRQITTEDSFHAFQKELNLHPDSVKELEQYLGDENNQFKRSYDAYKQSISTIDGQLLSAAKLVLKDKITLSDLMNTQPTLEMMMEAVDPTVGIDEKEFIAAIRSLQHLRNEVENIRITRSNQDAINDAEPDTKGFLEGFNSAVNSFRSNIEAIAGKTKSITKPSDSDPEVPDKAIDIPGYREMSPREKHVFLDKRIGETGSLKSALESLMGPTKENSEFLQGIKPKVTISALPKNKKVKDFYDNVIKGSEHLRPGQFKDAYESVLDDVKEQPSGSRWKRYMNMFNDLFAKEHPFEKRDKLNPLGEDLVPVKPKIKVEEEVLKKESSGEDIVSKSIETVTKVLGNDKGILKRIAKVESENGEHNNTFREGYHGGIFQVDKKGFKDTQDVESHPKLKKRFSKIEQELGIKWSEVTWEDLRKPLYSALAARLFLLNNPEEIPEDLKGQAEYWKKHYNTTSGKGTTKHFISKSK
jgi:hypothetical protein